MAASGQAEEQAGTPAFAELGAPLVSFPLAPHRPRFIYWIFLAVGVLPTPFFWDDVGGWLMFCGVFMAAGMWLSTYIAIGPGALSLSLYEHGIVARVGARPEPMIYPYRVIVAVEPSDSESASCLNCRDAPNLPLCCLSVAQERELIAKVSELAHQSAVTGAHNCAAPQPQFWPKPKSRLSGTHAELLKAAAAAGGDAAIPTYAWGKSYAFGSLLEHPAFGVGVVVDNSEPGKVSVRFADADRLLY